MGLRALQAQQMGLTVAGHNIANANTEGFSRQKVSLSASNPYTAPAFNRPASPGQIGTGVEIAEVRRVHDAFIEMQLRLESQTTGEWEALMGGYEQIEMIFNEPSDTGIGTALTEFWRSWQQLSLTPSDLAARSVVRQSGMLLADAVSHTYTQLGRYREEINGAIGIKVNHINYLGQQIADLNKQIVAVSVSGDHPNDLLDARDLLVKELSKIANIQAVTDEKLQMHISISGSSLVQGSHVSKLDLVTSPEGHQIVWAGDSATPAVFSGGELKGLLHLRDEIIKDQYMDDLDKLAEGITRAINQLHREGFGFDPTAEDDEAFPTGNDFFRESPEGESWALNMRLTEEILADDGLRLIAAGVGADMAPGNGENAIAIGRFLQEGLLTELDDDGTMPDLGSSIPDFFSSLVAKLGVDSQEAQRMHANQMVLHEHLVSRQQSVSGVSLDEEISDLIRFQHAYGAAARFITTLDESLSTVIERMGIVGR